MKKKIEDYIPDRPKLTYIQAKLESCLVEQVKTLMKEKDISWRELITAGLEKFRDEVMKEKKLK